VRITTLQKRFREAYCVIASCGARAEEGQHSKTSKPDDGFHESTHGDQHPIQQAIMLAS
jgi:hypothetical protein